jgi:hypothetical protein
MTFPRLSYACGSTPAYQRSRPTVVAFATGSRPGCALYITTILSLVRYSLLHLPFPTNFSPMALSLTFEVEALYAALPILPGKSCIRLLRVFAPPVNDLDAPIRCELSVADLDTKPPYCAISYVWATKAPVPSYVICDGVPLTVTENCYATLHNLRARLGSFVIWIDALCINQQDDRDKE